MPVEHSGRGTHMTGRSCPDAFPDAGDTPWV